MTSVIWINKDVKIFEIDSSNEKSFFSDQVTNIEKELPKMDGKVLLLKLCPLKKAGTIINIVVTYKLRM